MEHDYTKEEVNMLSKMWESEAGKLALQRMKEIQDVYMDTALRNEPTDSAYNEKVMTCVQRANGVRMIIEDAENCVEYAKKLNEVSTK